MDAGAKRKVTPLREPLPWVKPGPVELTLERHEALIMDTGAVGYTRGPEGAEASSSFSRPSARRVAPHEPSRAGLRRSQSAKPCPPSTWGATRPADSPRSSRTRATTSTSPSDRSVSMLVAKLVESGRRPLGVSLTVQFSSPALWHAAGNEWTMKAETLSPPAARQSATPIAPAADCNVSECMI